MTGSKKGRQIITRHLGTCRCVATRHVARFVRVRVPGEKGEHVLDTTMDFMRQVKDEETAEKLKECVNALLGLVPPSA